MTSQLLTSKLGYGILCSPSKLGKASGGANYRQGKDFERGQAGGHAGRGRGYEARKDPGLFAGQSGVCRGVCCDSTFQRNHLQRAERRRNGDVRGVAHRGGFRRVAAVREKGVRGSGDHRRGHDGAGYCGRGLRYVRGANMSERLVLKNRLKEARQAKGLSQAALAEMVGVSRNTISSIETGQFSPTAKLALILCIALDKKFEDLFYFDL